MDTFGDQCRDQDLAKPMIMSVTSLLANQHIALESQCVSTCTWSVSCSSTHAGQCSFSFLTRVSRNCIYFTAIGNAVVSVIAVYRLTDNLRPLLDLANIRLFTDLVTGSACLPSQTMASGRNKINVNCGCERYWVPGMHNNEIDVCTCLLGIEVLAEHVRCISTNSTTEGSVIR